MLPKLGVGGVFAIFTHAALLYYARNAPRVALAAIFFSFIFRILFVKAVLTIDRWRPTPETRARLRWFVREPTPQDRQVPLSFGGCGSNLLVFGSITYMMVWISYLSVAPNYPDFEDYGKGLMVFLVYDLKTLLSKDIAIDFDANERTNYDYNLTPLACLIALAFLWLPGVLIATWVGVDKVWGLLVPVVGYMMVLEVYLRTGWEPRGRDGTRKSSSNASTGRDKLEPDSGS